MAKEGNLITSWLNQYGDPEIERFVDKNLAIVEKVRMAMEQREWKSQDLALAMEKSPSEVSKWLSGTHNLTLRSIVKMEMALGVELINMNAGKEIQYVQIGVVSSRGLSEKHIHYEESTYLY